jgi:type I restriction enzyme S subunit
MSAPINRVQLATVMTVDRNGIDPVNMDPLSPFVGLESIYNDGRIDSSHTVRSADIRSTKHQFTKNHILFGKLRPYLRKIAAPDFDGVCSTDIIPLLPTAAIDKRFLLHWLRTDEIVGLATSASTGANLPRLSPAALLRFEIPLPPVDEQRRIATVFDTADELRRQRRESIGLNATLLRSVFFKMFGDPVTNPQGWRQAALTDVCTAVSGGTPSKSNASFWDGNLPWFTPKDLKSDELLDSIDHVSEAVLRETNLKLFPADTVLIVVRGMILAHSFPVTVIKVPGVVNQDIKALVPEKGLRSEFLAACLRAQKEYALTKVSTAGHGTKKLDSQGLSELKIIVPPMDVQDRFIAAIAHHRTILQYQRESLAQAESLFAAVQQRGFRGELDLSRLILDHRDTASVAPEIKKASTRSTPIPVTASIVAPTAIGPTLRRLDEDLKKNDSIPWSADYFKYRILAVQPLPFSFEDVMQRATAVFDEPPYKEMKEIVFDLLGKGGSPALLRQFFDLSAEGAEEGGGRKEIVFGPAT